MKHVNTNEIGIHTLSDAELDKVNGGIDKFGTANSIGRTIEQVASSILGGICTGDSETNLGKPGQVICFYPAL